MANLVASRLNTTDFSAYLRTLTIFDETGDNVAIKFRCSVIRADDAQNTAVFFESTPFVEYALGALNINADTADKRLAAEGSSVAQFTARVFVEAHDLQHFLQVISTKKDGTVFKSKAAALAELNEIITDELETSTEFLMSIGEPEWFSYLTRTQFENLTGTKVAPAENTEEQIEQVEQAAVDPEAELVASLEATLAAQEAAEQDAFEAAHADEMVLEPAADVDGDDWADDFVDDDDFIEDMGLLDEYAALSSDAVCMAKGAAENAKLVSGVAGSHADATCFAAQFVAGMVQDAQVAINDTSASVLDVTALMLDRVHLASFMGDFTRAHSMVWLYRDHLYSLTKSCGVYDEALVKIHAALEAAGLRGFLATEVEEVLTDRLAQRITEALEELNQVTNPAMMPATLERVNARVGALLAQGFGPDMGPATDPDNLRRRYAYREDAWRDPKAQVLAAIRRNITAAQATAPAEVAQAPAENTPAAAQSAQTETADGVDLSRYSDDVDTYLNLLTPQRPEPVQGSLVFPEVGDEVAAAGAQAGAAAPCAEASAIDWDEVDASDGFVYDPDEGAQFFTLESDAGVSADCARAQDTIARDSGVKTHEHLTQDDDATSALLEGVLRTDDEMADLADKVAGAAAPTSGKAACAATVTSVSANPEGVSSKYFGGRVEFVGFNTGAKANQAPAKTPQATEAPAEYAPAFPVVTERIEVGTNPGHYLDSNHYDTCKRDAPDYAPDLSPETLKLAAQNGLLPAPCNAKTKAKTLHLAWQALTWREPIKLTPDQEELVRKAFAQAREFLAEVIHDLDFWDVPRDAFNKHAWGFIDPYKASLLFAIDRIEEMTPEFTELRGALLEPLVQDFMCRMTIYQQAAGRGVWTGAGSSPYLQKLTFVPILSEPIAQTLNTSQSTYFAKQFVKACDIELSHDLEYAYQKSAGFYIAPAIRRKYSDIAAAHLTPILFWPFTESFGVKAPYWGNPWDAFANYNPYLMRNPYVADFRVHLDFYDVVAARSCETAAQLLHNVNPTEKYLGLFSATGVQKRLSDVLKADFFGKEDISGEISSLFSAHQVLSSTAERNLKTWRPNECYNGDYTREDLLLDTCLNGLSDASKAACTQIGTMVDEFVADAKSSKLIVWDKRAELEIKAAALWDKIHEAYPDLAQLRKQELHGLFWSELQQLMAGGWVKIELAQIPKVLDYLVGFYENGFMRDIFWEALPLAILRRYAPKDKEHNLRDKDREQGQLRIDGFKQALSWGYHQHSVAFELLFYTPREVLASYFHGWSWFDHDSIERDFEFTLRWVWSRAQDVVLGQEPHEKNPKERRKPGMEG